MKSLIYSTFVNRKTLILGFGREGQSSLRLLRQLLGDADISIADSNADLLINHPWLDGSVNQILQGNRYLDKIQDFDLIIKSPGIPYRNLKGKVSESRITSQTDLFLLAYHRQVAGITGTKGKSTTSSLLWHIIHAYTADCLLAGNIGLPLFNLEPHITSATRMVCELSSHQLQFIRRAPHIAVLLNVFQEHLDHYESYREYQLAKFQIALRQKQHDYFIWNASDPVLASLVREQGIPGISLPLYNGEFNANGIGLSGHHFVIRTSSTERILLPAKFETRLQGEHNRINILAAAAAASLFGIPGAAIQQGVATFTPLEHRIEFVGIFNNKRFYNDSISTIPEATIAAIKTLKQVDTLILGGFDRGIDYSQLLSFLPESSVRKVVFTGPAGARMHAMFGQNSLMPERYLCNSFSEAVDKAIEITPKDGLCLLSPAASSYDQFRNFEERGRFYKELVQKKTGQ